jgi:hypothetical protein
MTSQKRKKEKSDFSVVLDAFGIIGKWTVQLFVAIGKGLYKIGLVFWNWIDKMDEPKKKVRKK